MFKEFKQSRLIQFVFVVVTIITFYVVSIVTQSSEQKERLIVQNLAGSYVSAIKNNIFHVLSATYPIAALIKTQNGDVAGFTELAEEMLPNYPGVSALQLQPDGILKHVVPLEGNEGAIGHDLLLNPKRTREAFLARDTGKLTLAGPFSLVQGGVGAAARLPIYLDSPDGKLFWGFASVLMRFPDILDSVNLRALTKSDMAYQLSRIHPDSGKVQVISTSIEPILEQAEIFNIKVPNGVWTFKVSPIKGWNHRSTLIYGSAMGLLFIFLVMLSIILIYRVKTNNQELESLVTQRTESLNNNVKRLDIAMDVARQSWFDLNILTGESVVDEAYPIMLGYEPSEFHTSLQLWQQRIHPDDKEAVEKLFQQAIQTGEAQETEYRSTRKDGSWAWVHVVGEVIEKNEQEQPSRMIGVFTDVSQQKQAAEALRISEERYETIFEGSLTEIFIFDAETYHFIKVNQSARDNIGYNNEELKSLTAVDIKPEISLEAFNYLVLPLKTGEKEILHFEAVHQRKDGTQYNVEIDLRLTEFLNKATFVATILDVTGKKQVDEKLQLSARVFNDTHEGIILTDANKIIIDVNPAFSDITGYSKEEVVGQNPSILSSGKQPPEFYAAMWQEISETGHWQGEVWNRRKHGELYAELLTVSTLLDDDDNVVNYVGVFADITQSKQQQEKLHLMAHYDVLTKLPNRTLFTDRFTQAIAHSKRTKTQLAVCFLDLDRFKPINDNYGHEVGDHLLVEVAERIKTNIREEDTISRQGGDEFALLLNDIESFAQCEQTIERIHHALAQPYLINGYLHQITVSTGVTLYPSDDGDIDTLLRHADHAMYEAKQSGRNRYHLFNTIEDQEVFQKQHRLSEIEGALENEEFTLYYQPKVNMVTGHVFGAEALIRWIHPEKGLIPPLDFLPYLDGTELEIRIGDWVINRALLQLDEWHTQDIKLEVSVNVSSHHLQSPEFFSKLKRALEQQASVNPNDLQLEILESSALGDLETVSNVISRCQKELGVSIALDDFGTGYSSLTHLRSLTANTIKMDQSFVHDMLDDPSDYSILDGIIGLANSFSRAVIAEGVETTNHGLMLIMMGCEEAQGYGISRPMPATDIPQWLSDYEPNSEWLQYSNKHRTEKENKVRLFRLVTEHWKNHFVNNVQSAENEIECWPLMDNVHDHGGQWIKRAIQENSFEKEGLDRLEIAHDELHFVAKAIQYQYQQGDLNGARSVLGEFQLAFEHMSNVLGQCE